MFNYKTPKTEIIIAFHNSLNERDKRRHAAMIYQNSPWTIEYVSNLLSISENTIRKGYGELLVEDKNNNRTWVRGYILIKLFLLVFLLFSEKSASALIADIFIGSRQ